MLTFKIMKILFGDYELTEKQVKCYEQITNNSAYISGMNFIMRLIEERFDKTNLEVIEIHKRYINKINELINIAKDLQNNNGDYSKELSDYILKNKS